MLNKDLLLTADAHLTLSISPKFCKMLSIVITNNHNYKTTFSVLVFVISTSNVWYASSKTKEARADHGMTFLRRSRNHDHL